MTVSMSCNSVTYPHPANQDTQLSNTIYNAIFRRNYIFVGAVFTSAFAFEMSVSPATSRAVGIERLMWYDQVL
jgi:hypothetical protein